MSEKRPQTLANHSKIDPWFHYFLVPVGNAWLFKLRETELVLPVATQRWGADRGR